MDLVLLDTQVCSDRDEGLDTEDTDGILIIVGELSESWQKLLEDVLLVQGEGKLS